MLTFLKKLGQIIVAGANVFGVFSPMIQQVVPGSGVVNTVSKDIAEIGNVVVSVEAFGQMAGLPGAQKAKLAGPQIAQILMNSTLLVGKKIHDPVLFAKACASMGGDMADILNSLDPSGVITT